MWSTHSRRIDPISLSANAFCHGEPGAIGLQVAASRAPLLRMRSLWTGYLSARHNFRPRPLSVGTCPLVMTYKVNAVWTRPFPAIERTAASVQFFGRSRDGHDAPHPLRRGQVLPRRWVAPRRVRHIALCLCVPLFLIAHLTRSEA